MHNKITKTNTPVHKHHKRHYKDEFIKSGECHRGNIPVVIIQTLQVIVAVYVPLPILVQLHTAGDSEPLAPNVAASVDESSVLHQADLYHFPQKDAEVYD